MYCTVISAAIDGISSRRVCVEADVADGLPVFSMVGFLASETREAGERVRSALRNSGVHFSAEHVTINLAPASLHKEGALFDLAIAISLMGAYGFFPQDALKGILFLGELSLNGEINAVRGVLEIVSHAADCGCDTVIIPRSNLLEGCVVQGVQVFGADNLNQVIHFLMERACGEICITQDCRYEPPLLPPQPMETACVDPEDLREEQTRKLGVDFSQIRGQELLRRAAEIAVSGFHNLLMIGPPGAGKTMTAMRLPTILPRISLEEALQITKIHSVAGTLPEDMGLLMTRPFRAPHHTVTPAALCGGGNPPKPGEISLAHRGILYLDELSEYDKALLDMLRQPLEEGDIRISRLRGTFTFPAKFMLVASMNPCPCGYFPDRSVCTCTNAQVRRHLSKISMPLLDRIDMCVEARKVRYEELAGDGTCESSAEIRQRVEQAARIQEERYRGTPYHFNGDLNSDGIRRYCALDREGKKMMKEVYEMMGLTVRSHNRILKVARTIADLAGSQHICPEHLAEAVSYRAVDRKYWDSVRTDA